MSRVAVLAENDAILAFRALGMRTLRIEDESQLEASIDGLLSEGFKLIFLSSGLARKHAYLFDKFEDLTEAALIPLPVAEEESSFGLQRLRDMVRKAVGIDLMGRS